jgi:hypothetical protein
MGSEWIGCGTLQTIEFKNQHNMKRRNVIKGLAMLPVAGTVLPAQSVLGNSTAGNVNNSLVRPEITEASFMADTNIFRRIGVEPVINCMGTYTIIGGSIERQAVREAMEAAAHNFDPEGYQELLRKNLKASQSQISHLDTRSNLPQSSKDKIIKQANERISRIDKLIDTYFDMVGAKKQIIK